MWLIFLNCRKPGSFSLFSLCFTYLAYFSHVDNKGVPELNFLCKGLFIKDAHSLGGDETGQVIVIDGIGKTWTRWREGLKIRTIMNSR